MFRVAAAWQKVPVQQLTSEELNTSSTGLSSRSQQLRSPPQSVAVIASMPERGQRSQVGPHYPGDARRCRKTLRRISGIVRTEFKDRTKVARPVTWRPARCKRRSNNPSPKRPDFSGSAEQKSAADNFAGRQRVGDEERGALWARCYAVRIEGLSHARRRDGLESTLAR